MRGAQAAVNTVTANTGKRGSSRRNFEMVRVIEKGSYEFAFNHPTAPESVFRRLLPCNNQLGVAGEKCVESALVSDTSCGAAGGQADRELT